MVVGMAHPAQARWPGASKELSIFLKPP